MSTSIHLRDLTICYGDRTAVRGVTAEFGTGAVGLLGRNGAGKSSILRALLGLVRPVRGEVVFTSLDAAAGGCDLRAHLGYMPERDSYLPQQTGLNMVALLGMLSGMPRRDALRRSHEVLYLVGLEEQRYRDVASYSTGMRQKAKLAAALVHDPAILLLDEPTNGLDPAGRADMLVLIKQLCRDLGKSVVLSTHIMADVEAVCDQVVVLDAGAIVAQGARRDLVGGGPTAFELDLAPRTPAVRSALLGIGELDVDARGRWTLRPRAGVDTRAVFAVVMAAGSVVRSLMPVRRSLEDVFLQAIDPQRSVRFGAEPSQGAANG